MSRITIRDIQSGIAIFTVDEEDSVFESTVWDLSQSVSSSIELIHCNQSLSFLTSMEADATFIDWFKILAVEGMLHLTLLDTDYWAKKWIEADWNELDLRDETSPARLAFSSIFGPQNTGNPKFSNYSSTHSRVYKSGYNEKRLRFLLERVGFVGIDISKNEGMLEAFAKKTMQVGERQIASSFDNIRLDHKNRYQFACEQLEKRSVNSILDLACGIGYGSLMLANATGANVTGVDIDKGAIDYANKYYSSSNTRFIREDARKLTLDKNSFDAIVSFETIEHVEFDKELIAKFHELLKPGGVFICSTPNEDVMPFSKESFKFHVRHYRVNEIRLLLESVKFKVTKSFAQLDSNVGDIVTGDNGCFSIFLCSK